MDSWVFAKQKPKAKKWHGGHFLAAQGIERKYRKPPAKPGAEELKRKPGFLRRPGGAKNAPGFQNKTRKYNRFGIPGPYWAGRRSIEYCGAL
jgi:hypothetical protein